MKILFLAPQPFFQERGTPIAVRLALLVLSKREKDKIDLLTYHEGNDLKISNIIHHRIYAPKFIKNIGIGFSFKKLICDLFFFFSVLKLILKNRKEKYDVIHAVEESVFIAFIMKILFQIPYIYDMDSSMAQQLVEKFSFLKIISPILNWIEKIAIQNSKAVVPVCDALAVLAEKHGAKEMQILRDISLKDFEDDQTSISNLRKETNISNDDVLVLYVGNLEYHQGIDLLIESFKLTAERTKRAKLVIIGGSDEHIKKYENKIKATSMTDCIFLVGRKPVSRLSSYLQQADILASPRIKGKNTPMKIYSYLHSSIPIVATDLFTHNQVLNNDVAILKKPEENDFSKGILELINNPEKRKTIGNNAFKLAEEKYTFKIFSKNLNELYDKIKLI